MKFEAFFSVGRVKMAFRDCHKSMRETEREVPRQSCSVIGKKGSSRNELPVEN